MVQPPDARAREPGPWFRWHPALAIVVAVALYAVVSGLRFAVHGSADVITLLYVLPIALVAVAFGARAGAVAGGAAVALLVTWVAVDGIELSPLGWLSRATPMLLLGVLVGAAADRLREAALADRLLVVAQTRERDAAEINDAIVQRLAAAKWSLEAGHADRAAELLTESIETAQSLVVDLLRGRAIRNDRPICDDRPGASPASR